MTTLFSIIYGLYLIVIIYRGVEWKLNGYLKTVPPFIYIFWHGRIGVVTSWMIAMTLLVGLYFYIIWA